MTIMALKEIPLQSRDTRVVLKDWISSWEQHNNHLQGACQIYGSFWNQPEGCVSLLSNFCSAYSLKALLEITGSVPEKILQDIAKQALQSLEQIHSADQVHLGLSPSQIMFTKKG